MYEGQMEQVDGVEWFRLREKGRGTEGLFLSI